MSVRRSGFTLLVACLVAASLIALAAGSAQGEKGASWTVKGVTIPEALLPGIGVEGHLRFLFRIGTLKWHILCSETTTVEFHLLAPNGRILGRYRYNGCKLYFLGFVGKEEKEEELKACEPHEGAEKGVILTVPLNGLIVLNGSKTGVLSFEPKEGTTLFTVNTGPECSLGEKVTFSGKFALKDSAGKFTTDQVSHEFEEEPALTKMFVNGKEENVAGFDFKLRLFLIGGVHEGLTWAGHPA
jgi:hypothetical protein